MIKVIEMKEFVGGAKLFQIVSGCFKVVSNSSRIVPGCSKIVPAGFIFCFSLTTCNHLQPSGTASEESNETLPSPKRNFFPKNVTFSQNDS
jgi:hypothetical protein